MRIVLIGDIQLGRLFNEKRASFNPYSSCIKNMLNHADMVVGNLETTITNHTIKTPKTFNYRMNPAHGHWLQQISLTHANLANNHILDFGVTGMRDTQFYLDKLGIGYAGSGDNIEAASRLQIYTYLKDYKIGIMGAADHYKDWAATKNSPGINYFDLTSPSKLIQHVKKAREKVDFLIVCLHWGSNYMDAIPNSMRALGYKLIDAGANIIHGTSAHHILPVESYRGGLIIYSNGDFIDDYAVDPNYRNDLGMMVTLDADLKTGNLNNIQTIPTIIKDMKVDILIG